MMKKMYTTEELRKGLSQKLEPSPVVDRKIQETYQIIRNREAKRPSGTGKGGGG